MDSRLERCGVRTLMDGPEKFIDPCQLPMTLKRFDRPFGAQYLTNKRRSHSM